MNKNLLKITTILCTLVPLSLFGVVTTKTQAKDQKMLQGYNEKHDISANNDGSGYYSKSVESESGDVSASAVVTTNDDGSLNLSSSDVTVTNPENGNSAERTGLVGESDITTTVTKNGKTVSREVNTDGTNVVTGANGNTLTTTKNGNGTLTVTVSNGNESQSKTVSAQQ